MPVELVFASCWCEVPTGVGTTVTVMVPATMDAEGLPVDEAAAER